MTGLIAYLIWGCVWANLLDRVAVANGLTPLVWWAILIQIVTWPYSTWLFMEAIANQGEEE